MMLLSFIFNSKVLMKLSMAFISFVIAFAYYSYKNSDKNNSSFFRICLYSIGFGALSFFIYTLLSNLYPKEWDFTCFYLFGKVAANGMDFYDSVSYHSIVGSVGIPFEISDEFRVEVLDVGCLYPPQTLLLFLPFGHMSYMQAMYFYYAMILLAVIGCLVLIKNEFFNERGLDGWVMASIFLLLLKPLLSTVVYTQTLIFLLLLILLFYKYRASKYSGIFLALAAIIKPFSIILIVYLLYHKQWKSILNFVYTMTLLTVIAAITFGIQPFIDYFVSHPSSKLPIFFFTETTNQSLLAELYRRFPSNYEIDKIVYYAITVSLLIIGTYIVTQFYRRKGNPDFLFGLLFSIVLIIYPNGQVYYPIVHLLPLLISLKYIPELKNKLVLIILFFIILSFGMLYTNIFVLIVSLGFIYPSFSLPFLRVKN